MKIHPRNIRIERIETNIHNVIIIRWTCAFCGFDHKYNAGRWLLELPHDIQQERIEHIVIEDDITCPLFQDKIEPILDIAFVRS